jgi:hypothetical protein
LIGRWQPKHGDLGARGLGRRRLCRSDGLELGVPWLHALDPFIHVVLPAVVQPTIRAALAAALAQLADPDVAAAVRDGRSKYREL